MPQRKIGIEFLPCNDDQRTAFNAHLQSTAPATRNLSLVIQLIRHGGNLIPTTPLKRHKFDYSEE
eukprot:12521227-Prorocentrum_lima.AAC.1